LNFRRGREKGERKRADGKKERRGGERKEGE